MNKRNKMGSNSKNRNKSHYMALKVGRQKQWNE
jgi:hypothetical protein